MKKSRLIAIIALLAICVSTYAQKVNLRMANVTVKETMAAIKKQTGCTFTFASSDLDLKKRVTISVVDKPVEEAVKQMLAGQPVTFVRVDNSFVIKKKGAKDTTVAKTAPQAANNEKARQLTGTVVDAATGEPLTGAVVMPQGGGQGVATGIDGDFNLYIPANVHKARVSYLGYAPQMVTLTPGMTVRLETEETMLDEAIVIAYGTANKESLTGAVSVVDSKEIATRPVSNVFDALEGHVPGVTINSSTTAPGDSPDILVRGINTVNGSSTPLYVVDGVVWAGGIRDLNPNDVESMSVLKDAASCALYGAKGANGVILVTTKRAHNKEKVNVTLQTRQGFTQRALTKYKTIGYNSWNELMLEQGVNGLWNRPKATMSRQDAYDFAVDNFFTADNSVMNLYGDVTAQEVFGTDGKIAEGLHKLPQYTDTDWWKLVSRTGYRQEYNLSASAASNRYDIYASLGYLSDEGYIKGTKFERMNARVNANFAPVDWIKFGINAALVHSEDDMRISSGSSYANPFYVSYIGPGLPYYLHDWATGEIIRNQEGQPEWNIDQAYGALKSNSGAYMQYDRSNQNYLSGDAQVYVTGYIPYGFELTVRGTLGRWRQKNMEFDSPEILGAYHDLGQLYFNFQDGGNYNINEMLTWSHEYGQHHVDVLLSHENYERYSGYTKVTKQDMAIPGIYEMSNFTGEEIVVRGDRSKVRTEGYMGRARYNFDQKYFAEASIRRDGTSRLARDSRWGTFWSVGASWIISKEKFMQNLTWLDFLKIRASYGTVGSDAAIGYYGSSDIYLVDSNPYDGMAICWPYQLGNPFLKWESQKTLDLGVEANFFNNRLWLSLDYYTRDNSNMLFDVDLAPSLGTYWNRLWNVTRNIGTMRNQGVEIAVGGDIIRNKNVTWSLRGDISFIKDKVVKLPNGDDWSTSLGSHPWVEGQRRYVWWLYSYAGVDMTTGRALYELNQDSHSWYAKDAETNVWSYSEDLWQNNLEAAKAEDSLVEIGGKLYTTNPSRASRHLKGTSMPTAFGSFGTDLRWKDITLGLLFTYQIGGKTNDSFYASLLRVQGDAIHPDLLNRWTEVPEGMTADSPDRINRNINPELNSYYSGWSISTSSDRFLTSSSYLAFKNLHVNYSFPQKWVKAMRLASINLGMSVDNIFILAKRKGMNPTYSVSGSMGGTSWMPTRTVAFELKVDF